MLVLNQKQIKKLIPLRKIKEVIDWVERAFYDYGNKNIQMPPKTYLYFKEYNGDLRIMPAFSPKLKIAGTKIVNVHPQNHKKGLSTVGAIIILNDIGNGLPLVLLDGIYLTGLRTGAAGAVATKCLAKKEARTLGVVGAGQQAIYQIAAITKVRNIKEIFVFDIRREAVKELAEILNKEKIKIKNAGLEEAVKQDILVTTTPSRKPFIKKEWILPGTHINAIGADAVGKEELDPQILKKGKIVIDDWTQASHAGEINVPLKKGIIQKKDIYASLGEIVAKKKLGRKNAQEITIFDSTGLAIQDLYAANLVYWKAKRERVGKQISLS